MVTDKRYNTQRWKRIRRAVVQRDGYHCYIEGCPRKGNHCDHIIPVTPSLPDALFYGESNLRASCRFHNTTRGLAAKLEREEREGADPVEASDLLAIVSANNRPLPNISPSHTIFGDYSRKPLKHGAA